MNHKLDELIDRILEFPHGAKVEDIVEELLSDAEEEAVEDDEEKEEVEELEEADISSQIDSVWDDGGKTADRYTIVMKEKEHGKSVALSCSNDCDSPQGVSQWGEVKVGNHLGKKIKFDDLPSAVQKHVSKRLHLNGMRERGREIRKSRRKERSKERSAERWREKRKEMKEKRKRRR